MGKRTRQESNEQFYKIVAENVRFYREYRAMSMRKLAEKTNINDSTIRKLEAPNVMYVPSLELLIDISNVLEIPMYYLFKPLDFSSHYERGDDGKLIPYFFK